MRRGIAFGGVLLFALAALSCAERPAPATTPAETGTSTTTKAPAPTPPPAPPEEAPTGRVFAKIEPASGSRVHGRAEFTQADGKVTMTVEVSGLTPGEHAIHLHENGDCSAPDASSAGGHWNPTYEAHGKWGTHPFHRGDVGNLDADARGRATFTFTTGLWSLDGDPSRNVVGKAIVIHAKADDFTSQPSGNAGARVACGVIERR